MSSKQHKSKRRTLFLSSKQLKLIAGPLLACLFFFVIDLDPAKPQVSIMAGIIVWVATWWMLEATHIAVTAFVPFLLMPLLGVLDAKTTAIQYMDHIIFMFVGGFILAFSIEHWGLHIRLSLKILSVLGRNPLTVLMGAMLCSWFISMWISNTATTMMLLAAVLAIVNRVETDSEQTDPRAVTKFNAALMLGLAYSATIGGMATIIGTPTNLIFSGFYEKNYPNEPGISFAGWLTAGLPLSICLLASIFAILYWFCLRKQAALPFDIGHFKQQYAQLGAWRYEEKMLAGVLTIAALLWFFRDDLVLGNFTISGWANLLPQPNYVQDSTVAILMAFALFFIPSKSKPARALCTWKEAQKLPYDIILLFGSGFAIAKGFEVSGLSTWLASQLTVLSQVPPFLMILGICALVTLMSEFASNVATIQLLLPVLAALSQSLNIDPLLLMLPATFAASLGFMLPVATAPNTIVFGTGKIPLPLMLRIGLLLDVVGIILITLFYS